MNFSILYNPAKLIKRLSAEIDKRKRLNKLKNTPGEDLKSGQIDSLELLELVMQDSDVIKKAPVIYDIGSNVGTWTLLAKSLVASAEIHAFEPLKIHTAAFVENCKKLQSIHLHSFCLGNSNTTGVINISSYSDASSLLPATSLEFEHFNIRKEKEEKVEIKRLEDLIDSKTIPPPDIIKLDVQGYELEVLKGMGDKLNSVKYVICEVSFKEYYQGQPLFLEIANYLSEFGLQFFAFGHNTPVGAELNQIDVLFKRIG